MFTPDDDIREKSYLSRCVRELELAPSAVLCSTGFDVTSDDVFDPARTSMNVDDCMNTRGMGRRDRFVFVLRHLNWCSAFYSVYRAKQLDRVMPLKNIWGMDYVALLKLSLLGEFLKVPDVLYHRIGVDESQIDPRKQWESLRPGNSRRRFFLPGPWLASDLVGFIIKLPLSRPEKLRLAIDAIIYLARRFGVRNEMWHLAASLARGRR
jgi:hypothetical protein